MSNAINLKEKFTKFNDFWSPRVISEMNDYQIKLAKFEGEFTWHDHKDTDELFLVVSGSMRIELRDGAVELNEGEMYVVPKGVEHKPVAEKECHVMLIEPRGVVNTGDSESDLKAENNVWI
ncbi:cupin domain-containing protein [Vibrio sp. JC009]|uniref:cupin domain-containing protein n=1 Tax=Vibrio sp. JC009 TaxID=2912314 RepID=UPI0023B111E8|nr:cupin domain-containing protein [Vibrio sp. JC009]WED23779.1 cupin domain-containing protein [Vibrio sp. JC009]